MALIQSAHSNKGIHNFLDIAIPKHLRIRSGIRILRSSPEYLGPRTIFDFKLRYLLELTSGQMIILKTIKCFVIVSTRKHPKIILKDLQYCHLSMLIMLTISCEFFRLFWKNYFIFQVYIWFSIQWR